MKDGRVGAVKLEGGAEIAPTVERLVRAGIPVCGHLGFTPQSTHAKGGPRVQARDPDAAAADFQPRHTRRYLNASHLMVEALRQFVRDVGARALPDLNRRRI